MADPRRPRAYDGFSGSIERTIARSTPQWPPHPTAPEGSPNVIVVLCDDLGFADLGCYGSEIDTPNLDRLAAEGLRYTNFHVMPMCSPTRASLLTGLHSHLAGVGSVCHSDSGFPGYAMELSDRAATLSETLRDSGWATLMVGKWHLCKDSHTSEAGPRRSWPLQKGFDRWYGIIDGFTNFHQPHRLYEDNHAVDVDEYPDGYYFTDDITDRAIAMIRSVRASDPTKPFFLYFAHGAVHAPLQAKAADIEKYRGVYDAGWDEVRAERFRRQAELGLFPADTPLPPRNTEPGHAVTAWDELDDRRKELFARYMEIYAGMVDSIDQSFGRLRAELETMGEWDNTIVVFTSDNGGSREGQQDGTSAYFRTLTPLTPEALDEDYARMDELGGPQTLPHYPYGWAMASNTPFRLYKINTHAGGHAVPCIVSWPAGIPATERGTLRRQYQHVTDLFPTLLDIGGLEHPSELRGAGTYELQGSSMVETLADPEAPSTHAEQLYEQQGHRAFYRDGWEVVTLHEPGTSFADDRWELYHLDADPTESHDLATEHPERVAALVQAWEQGAIHNQVLPLDEGSFVKYLQRPEWVRPLRSEPVILWPGTPELERWRSLQLIDSRDFTVSIGFTQSEADAGTLLSHGDQGGGYGVYVVGGRLRYIHNGYGKMSELDGGVLEPGRHEVIVATRAPGGGIWDVELSVDGKTVGRHEGLRLLTAMAPFQGISVGIDRKSPVSWALYARHRSFAYTGDIESVIYTPGPFAPDAGENMLELLREMGARYD